MKTYNWNDEKNKILKKERGISFEMIISSIANGNLLDVLEHHNKDKYPGQKIFVVKVLEYVYLVPFIETKTELFLKTIIPSRKATKKYLNKGGRDEKRRTDK